MTAETTLEGALAVVRAAHPAPAVPLLVEQLVVGRWTTARAALAALKREGDRGLPAAPAVARWLVAALDAEGIERNGHALREALQALRGWASTSATLAGSSDGVLADAGRTLRAFFVTEVEPAVRAMLDGPHGAAHRGAVDYLSTAAGDRPAAIEALRRFLARPLEGDDDSYTRAAAITALQTLSTPPTAPTAPDAATEPTAEPASPAPAPDLTAPRPDTDAPLDPLAGDVERFVDEALVPLLLREFEEGPPAARMAALGALRQLGKRAERASAALWRLIRRGPDDDPEVERLRQRALQAFVPMVTRALPPDTPSTVDDGRAETARTMLIEIAMGDRHPRVRAEAIEALTRLGDDDQAIWAAAIEATNAGEPAVRAASTRLLAVLGVLARRGRLNRPPT